MGGTVAKVVKNPIEAAIVKPLQSAGLIEKPKAAPAPAPAAAAPQPAGKSPEAVAAQREQAEDVLAKRRARRAGRALLSEARLNPEQGVTTLGAGPML